MERTRLLSLIVCIAGLAQPVLAGDLFVNNVTGSDLLTGQSEVIASRVDGPLATVRRAIELALPGDAIHLANTGRSYDEPLLLSRPELSGVDGFPTIIDGHGASLRGTGTINPEVWRRVGEGVFRYQPYRKGHYQLIVDGAAGEEVPFQNLSTMQPGQWTSEGGMVFLKVNPRAFISDHEIAAPRHDIGVGLHNMRHVVVRNLTVETFRLDGVRLSGNCRNIRLENMTSTRNGRAGLVVSGTSRAKIGRLQLAGNRLNESLKLQHGNWEELDESEISPPPAARVWESDPRVVRLILNRPRKFDVALTKNPEATRTEK